MNNWISRQRYRVAAGCVAAVAIAAGIGLLAPDKIVQSLRKRHLLALEAGIPDALDMMVICGQAGLGLEASIERVGLEPLKEALTAALHSRMPEAVEEAAS